MRLVFAAVVTTLLTGCAATLEGLTIIEDDYEECATQRDCSVWSVRQLENLARQSFVQGFAEGQRTRRSGF